MPIRQGGILIFVHALRSPNIWMRNMLQTSSVFFVSSRHASYSRQLGRAREDTIMAMSGRRRTGAGYLTQRVRGLSKRVREKLGQGGGHRVRWRFGMRGMYSFLNREEVLLESSTAYPRLETIKMDRIG